GNPRTSRSFWPICIPPRQIIRKRTFCAFQVVSRRNTLRFWYRLVLANEYFYRQAEVSKPMRYARCPVAKHRRLLILWLVGILVPARSLLGQSTNAAITGQITDPLKAVIVQAKVTAINNNTNVRYGGTTNQTGSYLIPSVPPGDYRIEVEKTGFKTIVKPDVILHVQDTIELNFEMALGSASETITVTGGAPLINTQDATV